MDRIHQLIITDTLSFDTIKNIQVDILRPKAARRCFVSISKFNTVYTIPLLFGDTTPLNDEFSIYCDAIQDSYTYQRSSATVIRSSLWDTFISSDVKSLSLLGTVTCVAIFNVINNQDTWMEIDISRLNSLAFTFKSSYVGGGVLSDHVYNLHLRIKFSE